MNMILMLTPEGEEVEVAEKNFEAALKQNLEPALEYVTPQGETVVVRKKNFDAAEKQGLVMKPLYEAKKAPMESPGALASGAAGFAQWSPLGAFREEIAGAIKEPKGALQAIGELFGADYSQSPELKKYREAKQQYKDIEQAAWEKEPAAYSIGGVAGALSPVGIGSAAAKAPTALQAARGGAIAGGASGVGEAEGDLAELAKAAAIGAGAGGALGAASPAISRGLQSASEAARGQAGRSAYAATGALKSDINRLYERTPEEIGQELLNQDIIRLGTARGSRDIQERIRSKLKEFGGKQKNLLEALDEAQPDAFDTQRLIDALEEQVIEARQLPGAGNQALAERLQREADVLRQVYGGFDELGEVIPPRDLSLTEALELKKAFDKAGKYQSPMSQADAVAAAREARKLANRQIDETVEQVGGPKISKAYQAERRSASLLQDAKRAAEEQAKRDQANLTIGLRDIIAASPGATVGGLAAGTAGGVLGGVATVGLSKLMKTYGSSTTAKMMQTASDVFKKQGFKNGMAVLTSLYGAEAASDIAMAFMEGANQ
jgi:hypothetical protein